MKEPLITLFTIAQYSNISLFQFVFLQSIHYCIRYFFCLLSYSTQYIMCLKAETFLLLNSLLFHNFYNIWNMLGKYLMNYISKGNFQNINDVWWPVILGDSTTFKGMEGEDKFDRETEC